ncbi:RNA polymerase sigma factor [Burkholderiales bacterium GJ-E10]|nr:RNA polymerase sigma factor [Burkholderiales bacterium GJ-E10]
MTDAAPTPEPDTSLRDPVFLQDLRRQMTKFATLQLHDAALAEDAVQDALVGALKNAASFGGHAALKTWVFGILKNKIADTLRQRHRLVEASRLLREDEEEEDFSALFDQRGHWTEDAQPARWMDPEGAMRNRQFWIIFEACLEHLPGKQARAFMMREFVEMDTREICDVLGITVGNCNVMLHRARLRLRECLSGRWFVAGETIC